MTVTDIYGLFGACIKKAIDGKFKIGVLNVIRYEAAIQISMAYTDVAGIERGISELSLPKQIYLAINELHEITTKGGNNRWNKLQMKLFSSDTFSLEFIYDDELDDRISFLGLGGSASDWDSEE